MSLLTEVELTPGSGCGFLFKGDLNHESWLLEVKSTRSADITFDYGWVTKAKRQAKQKSKEDWAVLFGWTDRPDDYQGELHFVATDHVPKDSEGVEDILITGKSKTIKRSTLERVTYDRHLVVINDGASIFLITLKKFIEQCLTQS